MNQTVLFNRELINKYNQSGPRYTSYPTAPHFHESFTADLFRQQIRQSEQEHPDKPLSLYLHIPFCDTVCYYCACNRIVTTDRSRAERYLESLLREIRLIGSLCSSSRAVTQLHLGGGTPTYLDAQQLTRLIHGLRDHFNFQPSDLMEWGIEVDPREMPLESIAVLASLGFNRISIGVQDVDERVQQAVNRIQPMALTKKVVDEARKQGFQSINLDLIYGLPFQTEQTFHRTLQEVIHHLDPDRLAIFNYAHLPQYFPPQRRINQEDLPSPEEKLRILETTIRVLTESGYCYVGMDHFAKPDDELATAQRQGQLHRNFQGYTTHGECDLLALGTTAISQVGRCYAQNLKTLPEYYDRIDAGLPATFRGLQLSQDDVIRREVITRLMCDFRLDRAAISEQFNLDFNHYFQTEQQALQTMVDEGLVVDSGNSWQVMPAGRLLIRNICMVFDWYLNHAVQQKSFSRTI
ncbi:MAG: oxygen-independent coproporphyrinogen III oxidase [Magnetococcales bacterium]|nr:oxygen-independent coproporphyrinogen III oxidase [Magnetococcales bacterium]